MMKILEKAGISLMILAIITAWIAAIAVLAIGIIALGESLWTERQKSVWFFALVIISVFAFFLTRVANDYRRRMRAGTTERIKAMKEWFVRRWDRWLRYQYLTGLRKINHLIYRIFHGG